MKIVRHMLEIYLHGDLAPVPVEFLGMNENERGPWVHAEELIPYLRDIQRELFNSNLGNASNLVTEVLTDFTQRPWSDT